MLFILHSFHNFERQKKERMLLASIIFGWFYFHITLSVKISSNGAKIVTIEHKEGEPWPVTLSASSMNMQGQHIVVAD